MFLFYYYRYAFIRYNNVEESIAAYKQAHELMWDTRSIIVKFRRLRGNACLPGEPKPNVKKVKEKPNNAAQVKTEGNANHIEPKSNDLKKEENNVDQANKEDKIKHADKSSKQDTDNVEQRVEERAKERVEDDSNQTESKLVSLAQKQNKNSPSSVPSTSIASAKIAEERQQPLVRNIKPP